jgi:hypothetical protein
MTGKVSGKSSEKRGALLSVEKIEALSKLAARKIGKL